MSSAVFVRLFLFVVVAACCCCSMFCLFDASRVVSLLVPGDADRGCGTFGVIVRSAPLFHFLSPCSTN